VNIDGIHGGWEIEGRGNFGVRKYWDRCQEEGIWIGGDRIGGVRIRGVTKGGDRKGGVRKGGVRKRGVRKGGVRKGGVRKGRVRKGRVRKLEVDKPRGGRIIVGEGGPLSGGQFAGVGAKKGLYLGKGKGGIGNFKNLREAVLVGEGLANWG